MTTAAATTTSNFIATIPNIRCRSIWQRVHAIILNPSLQVIDLDTIDVSNLNRQFLFRPRHVGMPKAVVAQEMCLAFNPEAKIVAHHANIKVEITNYLHSFFSSLPTSSPVSNLTLNYFS